MHRHGVVHRDLKLENWLMQTPGDTSGVKLIDFGLSKHFAQDQNMQQAVGSTYYVAPGERSRRRRRRHKERDYCRQAEIVTTLFRVWRP